MLNFNKCQKRGYPYICRRVGHTMVNLNKTRYKYIST